MANAVAFNPLVIPVLPACFHGMTIDQKQLANHYHAGPELFGMVQQEGPG